MKLCTFTNILLLLHVQYMVIKITFCQYLNNGYQLYILIVSLITFRTFNKLLSLFCELFELLFMCHR